LCMTRRSLKPTLSHSRAACGAILFLVLWGDTAQHGPAWSINDVWGALRLI
jgi:hypothetical protein